MTESLERRLAWTRDGRSVRRVNFPTKKAIEKFPFAFGLSNATVIVRKCIMSSMATIHKFLSTPAMALVGMSRSGKKFGNLAYRELVSKGYRVYPIHPDAMAINGVKCYSDYSDLPEPVDTVLIVVPPAQAIVAIRKAVAAGIHSVWRARKAARVTESLKTLGGIQCRPPRRIQLRFAAILIRP
jgi:predicted CoA-binding protein